MNARSSKWDSLIELPKPHPSLAPLLLSLIPLMAVAALNLLL